MIGLTNAEIWQFIFFCRMVVVRHLGSYLTHPGTTHIECLIVFIVVQSLELMQ